MIIRPDLPRRCMIPMCDNRVSNNIARTSAPAGASFLMCDDCIKEAYAARFGKTDTDKLTARIAELESALKSKADKIIPEIPIEVPTVTSKPIARRKK